MGNFNRNKFSRGGDFKRRDFNDRFSKGPVTMHKAICDNCGKECEVPFRPTSGKPVYCSSCFEARNGGSDPKRFEGRNSGRSDYQEQFEVLNNKLDSILKILESAVTSQAPKVEKKKRASKK